MLNFLEENEERKVEYIELIYDLIFVHAISRCGSLLPLEHGIPARSAYVTFFLFSIAILEIWYYSILFINRFPQHHHQRNICIVVNMYLLYYIADGIRENWRDYFQRIHIAWALILIHLAIQYFFALRNADAGDDQHFRRDLFICLIEAAVVLVSLPIFTKTGLVLSPCALLVGIMAGITGKKTGERNLDFPHLTERVMLYVVFSFGEMIVELAGFFEEGFSLLGFCYSVIALAFAAGLFFNYGFVYDHVIDREKQTSGDGYLLLHLFLILSLSYLTQVMGMLRNPLIPEHSKILSLCVWLFAYVTFLSLLERYAKKRACRNYYLRLGQISLAYIFLLILTRRIQVVNFGVSVLYIYAIHISLRLFRERKLKQKPLTDQQKKHIFGREYL